MNKKSWDKYFIELCELISSRSIDPSTKHGCVIVDKDNRIISTGYNSPVQGIDDSKIPLTRPEKYPYFLHAEENAILFARTSLEGATVYITGMPCSRCLRQLLQVKVKRIVHGNKKSYCVNDDDIKAALFMLSMTKTKLEEYKERE